MKLSKTIAYAVQAMLELAVAEPSCPVSSKAIALQATIPRRYLLQILRQLVLGGVIGSTKGSGGGYYLARPADKVTLLDILNAFHDPQKHDNSTLRGISPAVREWLTLSAEKTMSATRKELSQITLDQLVALRRKGEQTV